MTTLRRPGDPRRVALGADPARFELKQELIAYSRKLGARSRGPRDERARSRRLRRLRGGRGPGDRGERLSTGNSPRGWPSHIVAPASLSGSATAADYTRSARKSATQRLRRE